MYPTLRGQNIDANVSLETVKVVCFIYPLKPYFSSINFQIFTLERLEILRGNMFKLKNFFLLAETSEMDSKFLPKREIPLLNVKMK